MEIVERFNEIYNWITLLAKESPVIAGVVSLWGLSVVTFIFRYLPIKILKTILSLYIQTVTVDRGIFASDIECFDNLVELILLKSKRYSRNYMYIPKYDKDENDRKFSLGLGYGKHYFWYNNKLFWAHIIMLESNGTTAQKIQISLRTFGINGSVFEKILENIQPKKTIEKFLYHYGEKCWCRISDLKPRNKESLAINDNIYDSIIKDIEHFLANKDWFTQKGLPYKLTFLLHGSPGTGKTSLIKVLATHFEKNILSMPISDMTNKSFRQAISKPICNSIILIEDFDSSSATKNRNTKESDTMLNTSNVFEPLTLSSILNGLDGIEALDGTIIFLTTNHLEHIDPAIFRDGRVDKVIEWKEAPAESVKRYSEYCFPNYDFSNIEFKPILVVN
jgi:SpoVK/Ycf46/Vps4 family AAA+-type ATPase